MNDLNAASAAIWTLLLGVLGVSWALLWVSARMHQRAPRTRRVFRSAAVGYLLGMLVVAGLLVVGPLRWPPDSAIRLWTVALALPVLAALGAVMGWARQGRRRARVALTTPGWRQTRPGGAKRARVWI